MKQLLLAVIGLAVASSVVVLRNRDREPIVQSAFETRPTLTEPALRPTSPRPRTVAARSDGAAYTAPEAPSPAADVVRELRSIGDDPEAWRAAIGRARPVLGASADVQILVGDMLVNRGDPVDGLAWQLVACMYCTQADERLGYGCAAEGFCDPNLALVDVFRRDFGDALTADALARKDEIEAAIATNDPAALEPFTEVIDTRFQAATGECAQLRTPTAECPPEEILRQTIVDRDQNINGRIHDHQPH